MAGRIKQEIAGSKGNMAGTMQFEHIRHADPILSSYCVCGFRRQCGDTDYKHPLSTGIIRDIDYDDRCAAVWGTMEEHGTRKCAADHIIELEQVKFAILRASRMFEAWDSVDSWLAHLLSNAPHERSWLESELKCTEQLWWPLTMLDSYTFMEEVKFIFNQNSNLCFINKAFNGSKNKWLRSKTPKDAEDFTFVYLYTDPAPQSTSAGVAGGKATTKRSTTGAAPPNRTTKRAATGHAASTLNLRPVKTGSQLLSYYTAVEPLRREIWQLIDEQFRSTGNLMFWAIRRILKHEMEIIMNECRKYNQVDLGWSLHTFDPRSTPEVKNRKLLESQVGRIMDAMRVQYNLTHPGDFIPNHSLVSTLPKSTLTGKAQKSRLDEIKFPEWDVGYYLPYCLEQEKLQNKTSDHIQIDHHESDVLQAYVSISEYERLNEPQQMPDQLEKRPGDPEHLNRYSAMSTKQIFTGLEGQNVIGHQQNSGVPIPLSQHYNYEAARGESLGLMGYYNAKFQQQTNPFSSGQQNLNYRPNNSNFGGSRFIDPDSFISYDSSYPVGNSADNSTSLNPRQASQNGSFGKGQSLRDQNIIGYGMHNQQFGELVRMNVNL